MDPTPHLHAVSDVFATRDALALGHDDKSIARLVRSGEWHRLRHGAYCAGALWRDADARRRRLLVAEAAYQAARSHVVLSHTSAADLLGAEVWDLPDTVHLTRTDARAGRSQAGVAQHRGTVRVGDLTRRDGRWATSGTRTALDVISLTDVEHGLVVTNALLHRGETSLPALRQGLASTVRWPRHLHARLVVGLADGRCESVAESRTMYLFWRHHLPTPIPQYVVRDARGVIVARLDFAWPDLGVFAEVDGKVKYTTLLAPGDSAADALLRERRREQLVVGLTGWRCVRLTWADLQHPERTVARVRAVLAGGLWAA